MSECVSFCLVFISLFLYLPPSLHLAIYLLSIPPAIYLVYLSLHPFTHLSKHSASQWTNITPHTVAVSAAPPQSLCIFPTLLFHVARTPTLCGRGDSKRRGGMECDAGHEPVRAWRRCTLTAGWRCVSQPGFYCYDLRYVGVEGAGWMWVAAEVKVGGCLCSCLCR